MKAERSILKLFLHLTWGTIRHPDETFALLAAEPNLRIGFLPVLAYGGAALLHGLLQQIAYGRGFLGTRPILADPTFVGGYGYLVVSLDQWIAWAGTLFWFLLLPIMWILLAGGSQVLALALGGRGKFEQLLSTLSYAVFIPLLTIESLSEWVFGIPAGTLSGDPYWWVHMMGGTYGPTLAVAWNAFVIGIYSVLTYAWAVALMMIAIRRVHLVSVRGSLAAALAGFVPAMFLFSVFVR